MLAAAAASPFIGTLGHALVWDDLKLQALLHLQVQDGGFWGVVRSQFQLEPGEPTGFYRPVVLLTFWLNGALTPSGAGGYHLLNLLLHVACTLLLQAFLRAAGAGRWPAFAGSLLFAVHPVHTESVAFVSGRTDLLAALFVLIAATTWVRVRRGVAAHPALEQGIGHVAFLLGSLSKEGAWVLPGILMAWDWLGVADPGGEGRTRWSRWWSRNGSWLAGWIAVLGIVLAIRTAVMGAAIVGGGPPRALVPGEGGSPWRVVEVLATYLRLLLVPWPLKVHYEVGDLRVGLAGVAGLVGVLLALVAARRGPFGRVGPAAVVWAVGFLVPVLGVVRIAAVSVADRFLYLPSVALAWFVAMLLSEAGERVRRVAIGAIGAASVILAAGAFERSRIWQSDVTLFENAVRTSPTFVDGHLNLGVAYARLGRKADADQALRRARELAPESADVHANLGAVLASLDRKEEAVECLRKALALSPGSASATTNLGMVYLDLDRVDAAVAMFERAVQLDPGGVVAWDALGIARQRLGQFDRAVRAHERAVALDDRFAQGHSNLGHARLGAGDVARALGSFQRAVELEPRLGSAHFGLALGYARVGDLPLARREHALLLGLDPQLAQQLAGRLGDEAPPAR